MVIHASPGDTVPIAVRIADGRSDLYPRARVVEALAGATPVATINLAHVLDGLYRATWTVPSSGRWLVLTEVFSDVGKIGRAHV